MKMIDIRWVKNRKTKKSSLKLVDRIPYNEYPVGTATVELVGIAQKTPEAKVTIIFPFKKGEYASFDYSNDKTVKEILSWNVVIQGSLVYDKVEKDYTYYIHFPNGKWNTALMNEREFEIAYSTMRNIKRDLVNLLK